MPSDRIVVLLVDPAPAGDAIARIVATEPDIEIRASLPAEAIAVANELAPTLVLLHVLILDAGGLALIRAFQSNPATAGTPIIVLSDSDDAAGRAGAVAEGANGFLTAPPSRADLLACLRDHAARSAAGKDTLDPEAMDRLHDADAPDFTRQLIDQFAQEAHDSVGALQDAAALWDVTVLNKTAHRLKGSASIMGAARLAALCSQIEAQVQVPSRHGVTNLIAELGREHSRVHLALIARRDALIPG